MYLLEFPILAEVELEQLHLLSRKLVDSGDELEVVLEIFIVVLILNPKVHHFLEDVPEALVVELLLVEGLLLLMDLTLEEGVLLKVQALCLLLYVLLVVDLDKAGATVFSCSVFSFIREVIISYFSYIMRRSCTYSVDGLLINY